MSFDGIVTRAVCLELNDQLAGGRVGKIYQPHNSDLLFVVRAHGKNHKLIISTGAQYTRLHLTKRDYDNPKEPPMFCMLMRKHLEGTIIESIKQVEFERIIHIDLLGKNDVGDPAYKRLVIELMGKHSNLILVDRESGKIIDSIVRLSPAMNRFRTVLPGQDYVAPPDQGKLNPTEIEKDELLRKLDFNAGKLDRQLLSIVNGFSPMLASEVLFRAGLSRQDVILEAFSEIQTMIKEAAFKPQIIHKDGGKDAFHVLPMMHIEGERSEFDSVSEMLETYFSLKAESDVVRQRAGDLGQIVKNEIKKNERKLVKLKKTAKEAEGAGKFQLYGELLTANMHAVRKGDRQVEVINYYDPEQGKMEISLNPNKTPAENAQNYFKKYNKLKTARHVVEEQMTEARKEIDYLETLAQQIENASLRDIEEIREELEEGSYIKKRGRKAGKRKPQKPELDQFLSSEGVIILVGKNNKQNEYLTMRMARSDETWFHTKDIPGSHVVIRSTEFGEATLLEAASLAAFFSKSQMSSSVPVDYTLIKHVHKPNGAKPGYVIYDHQKTVYVTPEEQLVLGLKENMKMNG